MREPPEEQIRRTLTRYCLLCDDGRFDEWSDLFTEDARFHVMGRTHTGREAITAFIRKGQTPDKRGKHVIALPLVIQDGFGGTAHAWTDFVFVNQQHEVSSSGRYHDELVRGGDDRWRFSTREIVFMGREPEITQPPPA